MQNLYENNFVFAKKNKKKFKDYELKLKKRKIEIVNEANSYRRVKNSKKYLWFEKLYSQGLSISTPLNINCKFKTLKSLRKGIEDYDKRRGWRGPITNKQKNKNWETKIDQFKLDPTLNWYFAEITSLDDDQINFKIIDDKKNINDVLNLRNIKWTIPQENN